MGVLKILGLVLLGIILLPFFLVFFCPIAVPYTISANSSSTGSKIGLIFLGILLGILLIPFFSVAAVIYFIAYLGVEALALCQCFVFDCCAQIPRGNAFQPSYQQREVAKQSEFQESQAKK